jgi:hypothetical protein
MTEGPKSGSESGSTEHPGPGVEPRLLAVDLGLRLGIAVYGPDGKLRWCRSHNVGSRERLRRAIEGVLDEIHGLVFVFAEGDRHMAELWGKAAQRRGAELRLVPTDVWRHDLLYPREQRHGADAKRHALRLATNVMRWSIAF